MIAPRAEGLRRCACQATYLDPDDDRAFAFEGVMLHVYDGSGPCSRAQPWWEPHATTTTPPRRWYRSWPMHNLIAHPLSEILHWLGLADLGNRIHDATLPEHEPGTGRG